MRKVSAADSPYVGPDAAVLRTAFVRHNVSDFENKVGTPRFQKILPRSATINRILDVGCGPALPEYLFELYPDADYLGVESSTAMLPDLRPENPKIRHATWNGPNLRRDQAKDFTQEHGGKFDLIVVKMAGQYFHLIPFIRDAECLLAPNGYIAISLPHPEDSAEYVKIPGVVSRYTREIGHTGLEAEMIHDPAPWQVRYAHFPNYRLVLDEVTDDRGKKKRLNMLLRPPTKTERLIDILYTVGNVVCMGVSDTMQARRVHRFGTKPTDKKAARSDS